MEEFKIPIRKTIVDEHIIQETGEYEKLQHDEELTLRVYVHDVSLWVDLPREMQLEILRKLSENLALNSSVNADLKIEYEILDDSWKSLIKRKATKEEQQTLKKW
jgi:hypothetical protein